MDKLLKIAKGVKIKAIDYALQKNAIIGMPESGKSYCGAKIAEEMLDAGGIQVIAIDPTGQWWSLQQGKDGNKGYDVVVVGGFHADLPLSLDTIEDIVKKAIDERISLVIDLHDPVINNSEARKCVAIVLETALFYNKGKGILHFMLEEAGDFIPQVVGKWSADVYGIAERTARVGRNSGIGMTIINQRAEGINKAVYGLCQLSFLYQQTELNSLTAIESWFKKRGVKEGNKIIENLTLLESGQCYLTGGREFQHPKKIQVYERKTIHPDPKHDVIISAEAKSDVSEFVQRLKEAMETKPVAAETETREEKGKKILRSTVKKVDKPKVAVTSTPEGPGRIVAVGTTKDGKIIREKDMHKLFENDENEISAEEKFKDVVYQKERAVFADEIKNAIKNPTEKRVAVSAGFKQISDNLKNNNMEFNEENFKKVLMQNTQLKTELSELRNSLSGEALVNARGLPVYDLPKEETGHIDYGRIVSEVVKHLLGERRVISPIENVKHQFLTETIDKIMNDINGLDDRSRKILLYIEQAGKGVRVADIVIKCFKLKDSGGAVRKPINEAINVLYGLDYIKKDGGGGHFPRMWTRIQEMIIDFVLENDGMSLEAQVQNLYDVIIMKLSGEK